MEVIIRETIFFCLMFLQTYVDGDIFQVLVEHVEQKKLLPTSQSVFGVEKYFSFNALKRQHRHVHDLFMTKCLERLRDLLDDLVPNRIKNVTSILGTGKQSLLAPIKEDVPKWTTAKLIQAPGPIPTGQKPPNLAYSALNLAYSGKHRPVIDQPTSYLKNVQLQKRFFGHGSAVFCVLYDRTGNYLFTGADDNLVKVWSVLSGKLLTSLRGHNAEVVDIAVNFENTMLASGAMDKMIRCWCLRSSACIAVLHGHTSNLTALEFSPLLMDDMYRYLISTGDDASVCFWKYTDGLEASIQGQPVKFVERSRSGAKLKCLAVSPGGLFVATGSTDSVIRIFALIGPKPEKIAELESHNDEVDSIVYANADSRFLTGSKDGSARIWKQAGTSWVNTTLKIEPLARTEVRSGSAKHLKVNMVAWSPDDHVVFIAVSDFTVRIFDSNHGNRIKVLKGHSDEIYVLEPCPSNPNVLMTGCHDGLIKLWNIREGEVIVEHYNQISGQGYGAIYDTKWSPKPNEYAFSSTDSHGHILRFGLDQNGVLNKMPSELFFHTDYRSLVRDNNDVVIDERSQVAPHLMMPPFLTDSLKVPYPPDLQRLVPGREALTDEQNTAQTYFIDPAFREVVDPINLPAPVHVLPKSLPDTPNSQHNNTFGSDQETDYEEEPTSNNTAQTAGTSQSQQPSTSGVSQSQQPSISRISQSQPTGSSASTYQQAPANIPNVPSTSATRILSKESERRLMCDTTWYKADSNTRELITDAEYSEFCHEIRIKPRDRDLRGENLPFYSTRRARRGGRQTRAARQNESGQHAARNALLNRALYDTDQEEDTNEFVAGFDSAESANEGEAVESAGSRRDDTADSDPAFSATSSSSSSEEYSDWEADIANPPRLANRRPTRRIPSSPATPLVNEGASSSRAVPSRVQPSRTPAPVTSSARRDARKSSHSDACRSARAKRKAKRMAAQLEESRVEENVSHEAMEAACRPPEWLTSDLPLRQPYFPQIGDEVMYFHQGHNLYLEEVAKHQLYTPSKEQPWHKVPDLMSVEYVRITALRFEIKGPSYTRLACLKLSRINSSSGCNRETSFNVKYHDMPGVIDFIVLRQFYERAMDRGWAVGDRFRSIIDEQWWSGTIKRMEPDSQFLSVLVKWEDGTTDRLSPWDLEPIRDDMGTMSGDQLTPEEQEALLYQPNDHDWPHESRDAACDRIANCLEQVMEYSVAEQFVAPVDINSYPYYFVEITYPMDLSLIRNRLVNRYYRRLNAIQFDLKTVFSNAQQFNLPNSVITKNARIILDWCKRMTDDESVTRAQTVYRDMNLRTDYPTAVLPEEDELHTWEDGVNQLLDELLDNEDSEPFRHPVDILGYPDYNKYVDTPMDLSTVREQLVSGNYSSFGEAMTDLRLIFTNSRQYNTNTRSKVYLMTVRLAALLEDRAREIRSTLGIKGRKGAKSNKSAHAKQHTSQSFISVTKKAAASQLSTGVRRTRSTTGHLRPKSYDNMVSLDEIKVPNYSPAKNGHGKSKKVTAKRVVRYEEENTTEDEDAQTDVSNAQTDVSNAQFDTTTDLEVDIEETELETEEEEQEEMKPQSRKRLIETSTEEEEEEEEEDESAVSSSPARRKIRRAGGRANRYRQPRQQSASTKAPSKTANGSSTRQTRKRAAGPSYYEESDLESDEDTQQAVSYSSRGRTIKRRRY